MNSGSDATGTEMSCLRLEPARRCASGMCSRRNQNSARTRSLVASAASRTQRSLHGARERLLQQCFKSGSSRSQ